LNEKNQLGFIHKFIPSNVKVERKSGGKDESTFLLLHGTGGNEEDLIPVAREISTGAAILSPRGKILEDGIAARFFRRLAEEFLI
jgi:phospholipase/carboxylesterase